MNRYLLAGAHINKPGCSGEYEIKALIGTGASCAVYYAEYTNEAGVRTEHLLKEFNPREIKLERDENGSLHKCFERDTSALAAGLLRFKTGYEIQMNVRRSSDTKNSTSNIQSVFDANGTSYIDMTVMAGKTYEKVEEKSLYDLLRRIKAITKVVGSYHENGLLHLDIKPENIFTLPETVELVQIFDFDSVIKKTDIGNSVLLSYTQSWAAQEQILPNRRNRICEATDIFAIGEILFYKLIGRHSEPRERRSFSLYEFDYNPKMLEGVNPRVFQVLSDIFGHTICNVAAARYQTTSTLLEKLEEAIKLANPHEPFLQHHLPPKAAFFTGRGTELAEIDQRLRHTDKLFISGMGGMGKSELVRQYAYAHKDEYDAVIFSICNTDLESMLLDDSMFPVSNVQQWPDEKEKDYFTRKYRELNRLCNERILIIVDNCNDLQDQTLNKLLQLNCKMLFTTRNNASEFNYEQLSLGVLEGKHIWDLFHNWYREPLNGEDHAAVAQIFDLYQGHTMAVELIAKQMKASCIRPKEMLDKLNSGGFSDTGRERINHAKDGANAKLNINAHIRRLFDVSELSEVKVCILANLSLIPPSGIPKRQFHDWCKLDSYEDINELAESGCVRQEEESELISLHPVVADIMLDELEKDFMLCEELLESASDFIRYDFACSDSISKNHFIEIANSVCDRLVRYDDFPFSWVEFINLCSSRLYRYGNISKWIRYIHKAFQVHRLHIQQIDTYTLVGYNNLAMLYHEIGKLKTAKKYYHRVLKEASFMWGNNDPLSQTAYNNLATLYMDTGEPGRAVKCLERVIKHREALPHDSIASRATSYDNLGMAYAELENYSAAIEAYKQAQELLSSTGYEKSEDMALSYGHLGNLYFNLGDYDNAESYQKKALQIWQGSLGENYIDTALAYYDLGLLYREKGQYEEAISYLSHSLNALEHFSSDAQEYIAKAYSALGKTYEKLKDFSSAEDHYRKALSIRRRLYDENHELVQLIQNRIYQLQELKQST